MNRMRRGIGALAVAVLLGGCSGETTPADLPAEQKSPDYGKSTGDKMKEMYGTPGKGGAMQKADAPATK